MATDILGAYRQLCRRTGNPDAEVAVRSSATAEDLPDASFAGQQETFLNIRGESGTARRLSALLCLTIHGSCHQLSRSERL